IDTIFHLAAQPIVDQAVDSTSTGGLSNWFKNFPIELDARKQKIYWWGVIVLLLFFSFLL
ncbi:MAG: hypothetical protein AAB875_04035, partial [Patescibacteria group bacterium]